VDRAVNVANRLWRKPASAVAVPARGQLTAEARQPVRSERLELDPPRRGAMCRAMVRSYESRVEARTSSVGNHLSRRNSARVICVGGGVASLVDAVELLGQEGFGCLLRLEAGLGSLPTFPFVAPLQGPQVSLEPGCDGALEQDLLDPGELGVGDLGVGAGRPAAAQGVHAALLQAGMPAADGLPGDAELVGDLGLGVALGNSSAACRRRASRAARSSTGLGRQMVGIRGCSHTTRPALTSTRETQYCVLKA
jgi:hypothetical protein